MPWITSFIFHKVWDFGIRKANDICSTCALIWGTICVTGRHMYSCCYNDGWSTKPFGVSVQLKVKPLPYVGISFGGIKVITHDIKPLVSFAVSLYKIVTSRLTLIRYYMMMCNLWTLELKLMVRSDWVGIGSHQLIL